MKYLLIAVYGQPVLGDAARFESLAQQPYYSWSTIANVQQLKGIMDLATPPFGLEFSHVVYLYHQPLNMVVELCYPYFPWTITGKPARAFIQVQ